MTVEIRTARDVVRAARVAPAFDEQAPAVIMGELSMPQPPDLDDVASLPNPDAGVPLGVERGTGEVEQVLDALVGEVEAMRRRLSKAGNGKGFMTTAADRQRAAEVERMLGDIARVLAERA